MPGTQNNANNAWNFTTAPNNNNKTNSYLVVPFFACTQVRMREIVTLEEVHQAYLDCRKRKGNSRDCAEYNRNYIVNNYQLYLDLNSSKYKPGFSKAFIVTRPKVREVFCAQFRDRIVHHLLYNKFNALFESLMIDSSYACRKGKGVLYGVNDIAQQIKRVTNNYSREAWVLKCDLKGFFMSINRKLLSTIVAQVLMDFYKEKDLVFWTKLWNTLILYKPECHCVKVGDLRLWKRLPKEKSLFGHNSKGLPIGNLSSQLLANLMMSYFDKYIVSIIGDGGYGRYVDDFVIIHTSKNFLLNILKGLKIWLKNRLDLNLHPNKIYLQPTYKGLQIIGSIIKQDRLYVCNRVVGSMCSAIHSFNEGLQECSRFVRRINSYFGHLIHHDTYGIRWLACKNISNIHVRCIKLKKFKLL